MRSAEYSRKIRLCLFQVSSIKKLGSPIIKYSNNSNLQQTLKMRSNLFKAFGAPFVILQTDLFQIYSYEVLLFLLLYFPKRCIQQICSQLHRPITLLKCFRENPSNLFRKIFQRQRKNRLDR